MERETGPSRDVRRRGVDALHVAVLGAFALAQPVFSILSGGATFFVARRSQPIDLVLLAAGLALMLPALLAALDLGLGLLGDRSRRPLHGLLVALLAALALMPPVRRVVPGDASAVLASAGGIAASVLLARWAPARTFLTVLAPAPLVFVGLFLGHPAVIRLLRDRDPGPEAVAGVSSDTTVVVLLLDELPLASLMDGSLSIDGRLYPAFARLAATSTWFRNATGSHVQTAQAVPSMLTGLAPDDDSRLPLASDHPRSLFTLLGSSHRMFVVETLTRVCPRRLLREPEPVPPLRERLAALADDVTVVWGRAVLPPSMAERLPPVSEGWGDFRRRTNDTQDTHDAGEPGAEQGGSARKGPALVFRDFVGSIEARAEPALYFLHVKLPHAPWRHLPSGRVYEPHGRTSLDFPGQSNGLWGADEPPTDLALQQHLLQLAHVDDLLGLLLERLEEQGLFDSSLLVVAADHGISFRPGEHRRQPSPTNARDLAHVPFFVKRPGQREPHVSDRNVETVDLLPTIADALGVPLPWETDGASALDDALPERPTKTLYGGRAPIVLDGAPRTEWPLLERRERLFGARPARSGLYAMGAHRDLFARPATDLGLAPDLGRASIEGAWRFQAVDPRSSLSPGFVQGTIEVRSEARGEVPEHLAITVDGVVAALCRPFQIEGGRARFAAMVPDAALRPGRNDLAVLALLDDGRLARLPGTTYAIALDPSGAPLRVERGDGTSWPVQRQVVRGTVSTAGIDGGNLVIAGWAAEVDRGLPAERVVLAIEDTELTLSRPTGETTRDLQARFEGREELVRSGFRFEVPLELVGGNAGGRLRVFALGAEVASELRFAPRAAWAAAGPDAQ